MANWQRKKQGCQALVGIAAFTGGFVVSACTQRPSHHGPQITAALQGDNECPGSKATGWLDRSLAVESVQS